jgi:hypothetical protein
MDPILSSFISENDDSRDSWLQTTYFDAPLGDCNDDYLVSPENTILDNTTSVIPNMFDTCGVGDKSLNSNSIFNKDSSSTFNHPSTPSLCDDADYLGISADSQPPTPIWESAPSPESEALPKRKRGRPRLNRADSESSYSDSRESQKSHIRKRQPHNEVERKYREGLNAGLERLRMAVPTLPHWESQSIPGAPKPSKAAVLAAAIDYIHNIEMECDRLQLENKMLKTRNRNVNASY